MSDKIVSLSDRIKELSHSTGTGNLRLDGAATGFSSFGSEYAYDDALYYGVTDLTDYEVGSGQYIQDGGNNALRRFPIKSSNSNALVSFGAGVKEVYVTYPGKSAVFTASGVGSFQAPQVSGVSFWGSDQIINYDSNVVWSVESSALGVSQPNPQYAIDVGGLESYSAIRASGFITGDSGVMFIVTPASSGGRQVEPFMRNEIDVSTGTSAVIALSGLVDQRLTFRKQTAGLVFAGPASGCTPPLTCTPDYPAFRALTVDDIPDLSSTYVSPTGLAGAAGEITFYESSGVIGSDPYFIWDKSTNKLGVNQNNPAYELDVSGTANITSALIVGGNATVAGNLDILGDVTYIDSSNVTIWDKQLELASQSGNAVFNDSNIDDGGIVLKSTVSDKKWTWRDSTDAWTTDQKIDISGIIFNDLSTISGAYHAGSGLELHNNIEFNVGNVFKVSDESATSGWIHQGATLTVSGASGLFTDYDSANNILYIGDSGRGIANTVKVDNIITVPLSGIVLVGEQVQNGVSLSSGDRVLLVNQADARENGIWEVGADPYGSWTRPVDFPSSGEASARWTHQQMGTYYDESVWFCVNDDPCTIDYDNQEWRYFDGGAAVSGWVDSTMSSRDSSISGWADFTMSSRDASISGWTDSTISSRIANITASSGLSLYNSEFSLDINNLNEVTSNTSGDYIANYSYNNKNKKISRNDFVRPGFGSVADSTTVVYDLSNPHRNFVTTLSGNRTLSVTNATRGDRFAIKLQQDSVGSRTITWWNTINWPGGTEPTLTSTAKRADYFEFVYNDVNSYDNLSQIQNLTTYSGGQILLSDNMVAFWKMDELGTTADRTDSASVTSKDLVVSGVVDHTVGVINSGVNIWAGSGWLAYEAASGSELYFNNSSFTVAGWYNIADIVNNSAMFTMKNLYYATQSQRKVSFSIRSPAGTYASLEASGAGGTPLVANTDYFMACVHDAENNQMKISINAGAFASINYTSGVSDPAAYPNEFSVGSSWQRTTPIDYDGVVDELGVWSRALTQDELTSLYNGGSGVGYPFVGL